MLIIIILIKLYLFNKTQLNTIEAYMLQLNYILYDIQ
jgi:hypothetical protein